jgi:hypothetical protein
MSPRLACGLAITLFRLKTKRESDRRPSHEPLNPGSSIFTRSLIVIIIANKIMSIVGPEIS